MSLSDLPLLANTVAPWPRECLCRVQGGVRYPEKHCPAKEHPPMESKTFSFCWCDPQRLN